MVLTVSTTFCCCAFHSLSMYSTIVAALKDTTPNIPQIITKDISILTIFLNVCMRIPPVMSIRYQYKA